MVLRRQNGDNVKNIILFGGTTEGKRIIEILEELELEAYVSVATPYGEQVLEKGLKYCQVVVGRMNDAEIDKFLTDNKISIVLDATHPYAAEATANIKKACASAQVRYIRIMREAGERFSNAVYVSDMAEAVKYLSRNAGNILLTTGTKDLSGFTGISDFADRVYARILPAEQSVNTALASGIKREHLICEKGPFTVAQNMEMLKNCNAGYLVTKDTGAEGGLPQKAEAAGQLGISLIIVERPKETDGITIEELYGILKDEKRSLCAEL